MKIPTCSTYPSVSPGGLTFTTMRRPLCSYAFLTAADVHRATSAVPFSTTFVPGTLQVRKPLVLERSTHSARKRVRP